MDDLLQFVSHVWVWFSNKNKAIGWWDPKYHKRLILKEDHCGPGVKGFLLMSDENNGIDKTTINGRLFE